LTYEWDFDGDDGAVDSTVASPQHAYAQRGKYTATVTNARGRTFEADTLAVFPATGRRS
jgi:PKD repeat protein